MCSRIFTSSSSAPANSLFDVYQFDFQSWMTPTRRPPGWTFWPISYSPPRFSVFLRRGVVFGFAAVVAFGFVARGFRAGFSGWVSAAAGFACALAASPRLRAARA